MTKPIELYFFPTPNGWKVSIALEEMELPYTMVPVRLGKGDQFKPEFLKFSPNNRMPAIIDPQGPGGARISVFESGAILQYLARKTGKFGGKDERQRVAVEEWLMWQMGGLGPMSGQAVHFTGLDEKHPYAISRYTEEVKRLYGVMDRRLEGRDYLADDYSIADMASWGWLKPHQRLGLDLGEYPNLKAWFERIGKRPAVQAGFALGAELRG
jgi:glutathione S-transferase